MVISTIAAIRRRLFLSILSPLFRFGQNNLLLRNYGITGPRYGKLRLPGAVAAILLISASITANLSEKVPNLGGE